MKERFIRPDRPEDLKKLEEAARAAGISYKVIHKVKNEYQLKQSRYYLGSDALYRENVYFIRMYPEYQKLLSKRNSIASSGDMENLPIRTGTISKPTENQALEHISCEEIKRRIKIIDEALSTIPEQYQNGVFEHVVYQTEYRDKIFYYANINTWKRWTQKFIFEVAVRRGFGPLIEHLRKI